MIYFLQLDLLRQLFFYFLIVLFLNLLVMTNDYFLLPSDIKVVSNNSSERNKIKLKLWDLPKQKILGICFFENFRQSMEAT